MRLKSKQCWLAVSLQTGLGETQSLARSSLLVFCFYLLPGLKNGLFALCSESSSLPQPFILLNVRLISGPLIASMWSSTFVGCCWKGKCHGCLSLWWSLPHYTWRYQLLSSSVVNEFTHLHDIRADIVFRLEGEWGSTKSACISSLSSLCGYSFCLWAPFTKKFTGFLCFRIIIMLRQIF